MTNHPHLALEIDRLTKLGNNLEYLTLAWNGVGAVVLYWIVSMQNSAALAGFGFVSLIHVFASVVVLAQLSGLDKNREHLALKVIALGYFALTLYLLGRSIIGLLISKHYGASYFGILWLGLTYFAMWALSWNKRRVGLALRNQTLVHVAQMNLVDAYIALAIMSGILLNAFCEFHWADPVAGLIIVGYSLESGIAAWRASVEHSKVAKAEWDDKVAKAESESES